MMIHLRSWVSACIVELDVELTVSLFVDSGYLRSCIR